MTPFTAVPAPQDAIIESKVMRLMLISQIALEQSSSQAPQRVHQGSRSLPFARVLDYLRGKSGRQRAILFTTCLHIFFATTERAQKRIYSRSGIFNRQAHCRIWWFPVSCCKSQRLEGLDVEFATMDSPPPFGKSRRTRGYATTHTTGGNLAAVSLEGGSRRCFTGPPAEERRQVGMPPPGG